MEQTVANFKVNDKTKIGFQNIVGEFCGGLLYFEGWYVEISNKTMPPMTKS